MDWTNIGEGESLIPLIHEERLIRDSKLLRWKADYEFSGDGDYDELQLSFEFQVTHEEERFLFRLEMQAVTEYQLDFLKGRNSSYIEKLKLFAGGPGFYLSLNPFLENDLFDQQDEQVVLAKGLCGFRRGL